MVRWKIIELEGICGTEEGIWQSIGEAISFVRILLTSNPGAILSAEFLEYTRGFGVRAQEIA